MGSIKNSSSNSSKKNNATTTIATKSTQGRGRSNSLPKPVVEYLKNWLWKYRDHPYPTDQEKAQMVKDTGLELTRLNNWFVNNRIRYWKPRMEALQRQKKLKQDKKEQDNTSSDDKVQGASAAFSCISNVNADVDADTHTDVVATVDPGTSAALSYTTSASPSTISPLFLQGQSTEESSDTTTPTPRFVTVSPSPSAEKQLTALTSSSSNWFEAIQKLAPEVMLPSTTAAASTASTVEEAAATTAPSAVVTTTTTHHNIVSDASTGGASTCGGLEDGSLSDTASIKSVSVVPAAPSVLRKRRSREEVKESLVSPRKKYQRKNEDLWRRTCQSGPQDQLILPTLDEAAVLFGFTAVSKSAESTTDYYGS